MKGYTQIKKEDVLKAVEVFEGVYEQGLKLLLAEWNKRSKVKHPVKKLFRTVYMTDLEVFVEENRSWGLGYKWQEYVFENKLIKELCEDHISVRVWVKYKDSNFISKVKHQALIAEEYVNCDTELSDFVYKYLHWEDGE